MSIFQTYIKNERHQQLFDLAERLANQAQKRVKQAEKTAQLPEETVADFKKEQFFSLTLPKE